jgi:hypothetical protein
MGVTVRKVVPTFWGASGFPAPIAIGEGKLLVPNERPP